MKNLITLALAAFMSMLVLVGCGSNNTPENPPSIPTTTGLPVGEPTLAPNAPADGYPAPAEIPTIDPASYPAPELIPTRDPASYPAP